MRAGNQRAFLGEDRCASCFWARSSPQPEPARLRVDRPSSADGSRAPGEIHFVQGAKGHGLLAGKAQLGLNDGPGKDLKVNDFVAVGVDDGFPVSSHPTGPCMAERSARDKILF